MKPKKLALVPLVAATYFMISGGAYGLEELVACGYGIAIAALVLTPVLWSLPIALMVGELASALPAEGGYYTWVRRAMGPFWGFQVAWLSLVASIFDMAIYPTLFTLYLGRVVPWAGHGVGAISLGTGMIAACAAWNLRGASTVGAGAVVLTVALLLPFAAFTVFALVHPPMAAVAHTEGLPGAGAEVFTGVTVAMWNYMGADNASTVAGEVTDPERTYPLAMLVTVALVTLTYVLPVAGAAYADLGATQWTTGAWVDAGRHVGGRGLALAIVIGGMISGVGMFNALLLSYSRVPMVLAEDGLLPAWLARRSARTGAPWASIVACSVAYAACLGIGFKHLVELDVLLYGASLVLEFGALFRLRQREPELPRPFKVPFGVVGAAMLGVPPVVLLCGVLWNFKDETLGPIPSLAFGSLIVALGPLVYALRRSVSPASARSRRS